MGVDVMALLNDLKHAVDVSRARRYSRSARRDSPRLREISFAQRPRPICVACWPPSTSMTSTRCVAARNRRCSDRTGPVGENASPELRIDGAGATRASAPHRLAWHASRVARPRLGETIERSRIAQTRSSPDLPDRWRCHRTTPTPNPSPQGGGEHTELAALPCEANYAAPPPSVASHASPQAFASSRTRRM